MTNVVVIQFPGVNCEYESVRVLEAVGLSARVVRWNAGARAIASAAAIVVPGGFSYQDRIRAGVVAAKDSMTDAIMEAAARDVPVLGVCNGAQILVEAGAVPGFQAGSIDLALAPNRMPDRTGYFCAWVRVKKGPARCLFTEFMTDLSEDRGSLPIPIGHAEGRFTTASPATMERLERGEGVALVYASHDGGEARTFPDNPNGSMLAIAGVTNPGGNVLALMPHPERASWMHQVPESIGGAWSRRRSKADLFSAGPGRGFFESLRRALAP
jgi:phosphoribosylformylglycinamidine synthase